MDVHTLYHMLRLEVLHPNLFTFSRDGPLPLMWKNLTTRSKSLQPSEVEALTDRTALIAGGPSGCGLQLAKILAMPCSHLIITAPNSQRDQQIVEEHLKGLPNDTIRNLISMCGHSRWSPSGQCSSSLIDCSSFRLFISQSSMPAFGIFGSPD